MNYQEFIENKRHTVLDYGFEPVWLPDDCLFDFQRFIIDKAIKKGRMGIFADTGLGKTRISLAIANNIVKKTNKRVLILTPLAVAFQFLKEAELMGIDDIEYSKEGKFTKKIILCNYERLKYFNDTDFECVILDESSILKNFNGQIKTHVTYFMRKVPYRFLTTATPSPNDYIELGTSSEALGYLGYMDMLKKFFKNNQNDIDSNNRNIGEQWYLRPHAERAFFEWVNSWSIMVKKPSDIGFSNDRYRLPKLITNIYFVENQSKILPNGQTCLFVPQAKTMTEVRVEQKQTEEVRAKKAVELAEGKTSVYWVNTNNESSLIKHLDSECTEIIGSQSIEQKEEILKAFANGEIKRLVTKAKITGMGLNWQHCNHCVFFPTWSYEQYYQAIRRFWRFGQKNDVTVDLVLSDGQSRVIKALKEKTKKAEQLYENLVKNVNSDFRLDIKKNENVEVKIPSFLRGGENEN